MDEPGFVRVLYSAKDIDARIPGLAQSIHDGLNGVQAVTLIGVHKGAIPFYERLAPALEGLSQGRYVVEKDSIRVKSYHGTTSTGRLNILKDLDHSVEGKNVVLVEDVADTGVTVTGLVDLMRERKAHDIKLVALVDKPKGRKVPFKPDYTGFTYNGTLWLLGCGMDLDERFRDLADIWEYDPAKATQAAPQ